jgi:tetratricopeptide (TPR) repeat protein
MRCWLVVAAAVAAGTAGGVEVTPHAGEDGRAIQGPPLPLARSARAVQILKVEVVSRPVPAVRVRMSGPAELHARTLRPDSGAPPRIYVDVSGSALDPAVPRSMEGVDPIVRVRTGQFNPSTARIIIDLARESAFDVSQDGRTGIISIGTGSVARAPRSSVRKTKDVRPKPAVKPPPRAPAPAKTDGAPPPPSEPAGALAEPMGPTAPERGAEAALRPAPPPVTAVDTLPRMTRLGSVLFAWPALDSPAYADPGLDPFRRALGAWQGETPPAAGASPGPPDSPAALYLAADLAFLEATGGRGALLTAAAAYEHALREAPDFADAARGHFMLGQAHLALGFGPEAGAAFVTLERRFPESPLVPDALVGQALSLRLRHRVVDARGVVDQAVARASGEPACRARLAQAEMAGTPGAAAIAYRRLAEACPRAADDPTVLRAHAESLARANDRDGAWRVLSAPRDAQGGDEEGRLRLFAASIAPDRESARAEYERVLGMKVSPEVGLEAEMRLVLLDAPDGPEKAAAALAALADRPGPVRARALILAEAADASARAGRFEQALALLDRAAGLGPEGAAQAETRRGPILGHWIGNLAERGDDAGVATVYAAYTTVLHEIAAPEDRLVVARALRRIGLDGPALRLFEQTAAQTSDPETAITLAEEVLAAGDAASARAMLARLKKSRPTGRIAARLHAAAARTALLADDVEGATAEASATDDLGARADVARALLARPGGAAAARALLDTLLAATPDPPVAALVVAGAAALEEQAWDAASVAYGRALQRAAPGVERAEAAAGLVRAARGRGDQTAAATALAQVAEAGGLDRRILARLSAASGQAQGAGR